MQKPKICRILDNTSLRILNTSRRKNLTDADYVQQFYTLGDLPQELLVFRSIYSASPPQFHDDEIELYELEKGLTYSIRLIDGELNYQRISTKPAHVSLGRNLAQQIGHMGRLIQQIVLKYHVPNHLEAFTVDEATQIIECANDNDPNGDYELYIREDIVVPLCEFIASASPWAIELDTHLRAGDLGRSIKLIGG
jgi:hypothetical protein